MYAAFFKRILDLVLVIIATALLWPLILLLVGIVKFHLGTPVLFRQQRPGLRDKPFIIYKFRTMKDTRDIHGNFLPDIERLTTLGRFLRSTSLDELPEFINVIKGDMSLVGPRPLLMQYLNRYTPDQRRRHEVRSGITGWAQINGRNALSWEERFILDVWYVDNISFCLDIKIISMTVWKVFKREGISQAGQATMEEFQGTQL
jgi:sugar transferase EpsL